MSAPQRIQLRRTKGWRKPPNTVVVARPSRWGNPFRVLKGEDLIPLGGEEIENGPGGEWHVVSEDEWSHQEFPVAAWPDERSAVESAVEHFRYWATEAPGHYDNILRHVSRLRGKNLACWCPLDQPCHADVLLELANPEIAATSPSPSVAGEVMDPTVEAFRPPPVGSVATNERCEG